MAKGFILTPVIFVGILCIAFLIFVYISRIDAIVNKGIIYESGIEKANLELSAKETSVKSFAFISLLNASRFENTVEGLFNSGLNQLKSKFNQDFEITNLTSDDPLLILLSMPGFSFSGEGLTLTSSNKNLTFRFNYPFINFTKAETRFNENLFCGNCTRFFDCSLYINNFTLYDIPELNVAAEYIYFGDDTSYVWFYSNNSLTTLDTSTCGSNYDSGCKYPHYIFNKKPVNCTI